MIDNNDHKYMQRAIDLAQMAGGNTRPNPLVGSVIVCDDTIIGEGYHVKAGEAHAEINAIVSVKNRELLSESTIYVSLEPCSHYGRTPPCALRIINKGIPRVVIAARDTSLKVAGKGIKMMRDTGIEVIEGIMQDEARELNKRFFSHHEKKRPYIVLKWAESSDGYIDRDRLSASDRRPNWITGLEERVLVHKWRSEEHSVLVGENTVCNDDPGLDLRLWSGLNPLRLVLSEKAELPADLKIFRGETKTLIFTLSIGVKSDNAEYFLLKSRETALTELLSELYRREIQSVFVEGGYSVLSQFIDAGLWDEARIFRGKISFGSGLISPELEGRKISEKEFPESKLEYWLPHINKQVEV